MREAAPADRPWVHPSTALSFPFHPAPGLKNRLKTVKKNFHMFHKPSPSLAQRHLIIILNKLRKTFASRPRTDISGHGRTSKKNLFKPAGY